MEAAEALAQMVIPSQRRKGVWLDGICQVMITRACNLSCVHCSAGSDLGGKPMMMTVEQFRQACISLESYFGVVGVFGGNPAIHPQFDKICEVMRGVIPFPRRGLWCNALLGKGAHARVTFNPKVSNLNVHMDREAYEEFRATWPESTPYLKGLDRDSVHSSPWVSMTDLGIPEEKRWEHISKCDINRWWSSLIGVWRGELRMWFCEIAAHQAMLNEGNPDYPDTGLPVTPDTWRRPMADWEHQVRAHCHDCGIPLRRPGRPALGSDPIEFSETHRAIARPKVRDRQVSFVGVEALTARPDRPATQYLPGVSPGYKGE